MPDTSSFRLRLDLTPEEKCKIDRLAAREGLSPEEAVLHTVEQVLHETQTSETHDVLTLAQSVYDGLDAPTRDAVEAIALDRSFTFRSS